MIPHRLVLATALFACLGTACTAIVLGKLSASDDYKPVKTGSSSGSAIDECSILKDRLQNTEHDANPCSTCIQDNCPADLTYACNSGKHDPKSWFDVMKECAQNPWDGFSPPGESTNFGRSSCTQYEKTKEVPPDDGGDTQREAEAHNCINSKCLLGTLPACKQCEVHIKKSDVDDTEALLRDDPCGGCIAENCKEELVACCSTSPGPMSDFVKHCAFTPVAANKTLCLELGKAVPDAGINFDEDYGDAGHDCLSRLSACFKANCAGKPAYKCQ
jgi:hypothetical protein